MSVLDDVQNRFHRETLTRVASDWRLTPATFAHKISRGQWIAKEHLLYISSKIARGIARGNARIIVSMPPRHGKPIFQDELILMGDGTYKPLKNVMVGDMVISHTGIAREVLAVHEQGVLPLVKITTRCGREIRAAVDHPFMTADGWCNAGDLRNGQFLAVVKPSIARDIDTLRLEEARLLGYFIGDGCVVTVNEGKSTESLMSRMICHDPAQVPDLFTCAEVLGFGLHKLSDDPGCGRYDFNGGVRPWLRSMGIAGMNSHTKRVPEVIFKASNEVIANFVGAYFACDGTVGGHVRQMTVNPLFVSCNKLLLLDVQALLLRLGIRSQIYSRWSTGGYLKGSWEYRLQIQRRHDVELFAQLIPIYGKKRQLLQDKIATIYGKKRLNSAKQVFDNPVWTDDEIVSVETVQPGECRCLTVAVDETFTVQNVVVHNSELISINGSAWALEKYPDRQVVLTTYGADLSVGFGRRVRDIFTDPNNAELLRTKLRRDAGKVSAFLTQDGGGMYSVGIGGPITGRGADILLVDDYIKEIKEALSPTYRDYIWNWFVTTAFTRLEPGGSCIIIATRWHSDDLIGRVLVELADQNWEYIEIPAIAEEGDVLGREVGAPLFPERYPLERLQELKLTLGSMFFQALYQQKPVDETQKISNGAWLKVVKSLPFGRKRIKVARAWDLASTSGGGDYTVGVHGVYYPDEGELYITNVVRRQMSPAAVETVVAGVAAVDGVETTIFIEQESGSSGKALINHYQTNVLRPYIVKPIPATTKKLVRAQPFLAAAEAGKVFLLEGSWNTAFVREFDTFPGAYDDQVDAASMCYTALSGKKVTTASWGRKPADGKGYAAKQAKKSQFTMATRASRVTFGRRS